MPSIGITILTIQPIFFMVGSFLADFNETHVYNPRWPPHARFHNGQTMSMSVALCVASLYYTWREPSPTTSTKKDSLFTAAVFGSLYTLTAVSAILYPGSKGMDPEYGEGFPQKFFVVPLAIEWLGYWLETKRIDTETSKKAA